MSRRLVALAALAVVLGCAGCDAADLDSAKATAASTGDALTAEASKQLDEKTADATAAAKEAAADLTATAQEAVKEQIAAAVKEATDAAVKTAVEAAVSAAPSPAASPVSAASTTTVAAAPVQTTHTVTGTYTSPEVVDASGGSVPCATATNVVGQEVVFGTGTTTVKGVLTACAWSAPGVLGSSPVFSFEVREVPEATSYDVSIGDRSWKVSGTTLAAAGWKLALT